MVRARRPPGKRHDALHGDGAGPVPVPSGRASCIVQPGIVCALSASLMANELARVVALSRRRTFYRRCRGVRARFHWTAGPEPQPSAPGTALLRPATRWPPASPGNAPPQLSCGKSVPGVGRGCPGNRHAKEGNPKGGAWCVRLPLSVATPSWWTPFSRITGTKPFWGTVGPSRPRPAEAKGCKGSATGPLTRPAVSICTAQGLLQSEWLRSRWRDGIASASSTLSLGGQTTRSHAFWLGLRWISRPADFDSLYGTAEGHPTRLGPR
jgi:hypothetical protein